KPQIKNFTINEQAGTETVTEGNTNVTFICEARGRPTPTINISFGSPQVPRGGELWDDNTTSGLTYTIPTVTCDDGGLYTCTADNGYREPASKSVQLTVNSCGSNAHPLDLRCVDIIMYANGYDLNNVNLQYLPYKTCEEAHGFSLQM
ncbi:hypothetical protein BaRGS_00030413, partial [Batillaria attramentaria]